jgi:hypothetical protein
MISNIHVLFGKVLSVFSLWFHNVGLPYFYDLYLLLLLNSHTVFLFKFYSHSFAYVKVQFAHTISCGFKYLSSCRFRLLLLLLLLLQEIKLLRVYQLQFLLPANYLREFH